MKILLLILILFLTGCLATTSQQHSRVDETPLYGGIDRSQFPELAAADLQFIYDVTKDFGSRESQSIMGEARLQIL